MNWSKPETHGVTLQYGFRSHTATLVKDKIYLFGGLLSPISGEVREEEDSPLYIFDPETMFWSKPTTTGTRPINLRAHTAVLWDQSRILVYGGGNQTSYADDVFVLDTETLHWSKLAPEGTNPGKRRSHTAAMIKGKMYVFGGGNGNAALNDMFVLSASKVQDREKFEWKQLSPTGTLPSPRGYHGCAVYNDMLYIFGGSSGVPSFDDMFQYDPVKNVWTKFGSAPPVYAHSSAQFGPLLYHFGGNNSKELFSNFSVLNFNKKEPKWTQVDVSGEDVPARANTAAVVFDSRLFLFGGSDKVKTHGDVWICDFGITVFNGLKKEEN